MSLFDVSIYFTIFAFFLFAFGSPRHGFYRRVLYGLLMASCVFGFSIFTDVIFGKNDFNNKNNLENVAAAIYCPLNSSGNYSGSCVPAYSKHKSFMQYYMGEYKNPNLVRFDRAGQVIKNKASGELYLEVFSKKFDKKKTDQKAGAAYGFIKLSDVPKVFDQKTDINKLVDKSISIDDKRFLKVTEFSKADKKPVIGNHSG